MSRDQLKKISTCRLCGKKGHWAEDCTSGKNPVTSKTQGFSYTYMGGGSTETSSHFSFLSAARIQQVRSEVAQACQDVLQCMPPQVSGLEQMSFLTIPSGEAILDIGATQDLIGEEAAKALEGRLREAGLRVIEVDMPRVEPSGIGGAAKVSRTILVPVSIGGVPGTLFMTVLEANIPPLLSVGFLEFLKTKIDLEENRVFFGKLGVDMSMQRLPSGHRCVSLVEWTGGIFPIAPEVQKKHGLARHAFNLAPSSYFEKEEPDRWDVISPEEKHLSNPPEEGVRIPRQGRPSSDSSMSTSSSTTTTSSTMTSRRTSTCAMGPPTSSRSTPSPPSSMSDAVALNTPWKAEGERPGQSSKNSSVHSGAEESPDDELFPQADVMGGILTTSAPQFAQSFRLSHDHGAPCQAQRAGERPRCGTRCEPMEWTDDSAPLPDGDHPSDAAAPHEGREDPEERQVRAGEVRGGDSGHKHTLHSSRAQSTQQRKSVCFMDSVRSLRRPHQLREEEVQGEGQGQEPECRGRHPPVSHQPGIQPDRRPYHSEEFPAGGGDAAAASPGVQSSSLGSFLKSGTSALPDGPPGEHPRDIHGGHGHPQPGRADHDCIHGDRDSGGRHQPGPHAAVHEGSSHGLNSDLGSSTDVRGANDAGGTQRLGHSAYGTPSSHAARPWSQCSEPGRLGADESQCREHVAPRWPTWLTRCAVAATMAFVPFNDLTLEARALAEKASFTSDIYVFHSDTGSRTPDVPSGMIAMFVPQGARKWTANSSNGKLTCPTFPDGEQLLWHEIYNQDTGEVLEKGPLDYTKDYDGQGDCRLQGQWWTLPRSHRLGHSWAASTSDIRGLDEGGQWSHSGPYWMIRSPALSTHLHEHGREVSKEQLGSAQDRCEKKLSFLAGSRKNYDFAEVFSPPRVSPHVQKKGMRVPSKVFDLSHGWDVRRLQDRQDFRQFQDHHRPGMAMFSPECKAYSQLMNVNWGRMDPKKAKTILAEGQLMWNFSLEGAHAQLRGGDDFGLERPAGASSWQAPRTQELIQKEEVALIAFDQCMFGLSVVEDGGLSRKRTKFATSNPHLAQALMRAQCDHSHHHVALENGRPHLAQKYPNRLCQAIAQAVHQRARCPQGPSFFEEDPDEEMVESEVGPQESLQGPEQEVPVTESQKRLLMKVHVNTGHPPLPQFLRMLRAAGTHDHILKFVKNQFKCDQCSVPGQPKTHRRAQCPRSFAFNKIVAVDIFYVSYKNSKIPVLNMICTGTNYHVVQRLEVEEGLRGGTPRASTVWQHFLASWVRFLGAPQMVISDNGSEFRGRFERGCEDMGILQHLVHPEQPWQNGRAERHGGWLKQKLDKEIMSGQGCILDVRDLDELMNGITSAKNRWFARGGYTPTMLVFGELPRVPGELMSDDVPGILGLDDALQDLSGADEASAEFRRRHHIRERARQLAMEQNSKEAIHRAARAFTHQQVSWAPGQWVYVFRKGRQGQELHPRDRWVGPGVVLLCNNSTVYVAMKSRLWRCGVGQLRAALPAEVLGRELASDPGLTELLRQVTSGVHTGAVDVSREGPPPQHALDSGQIEKVDGVGQLQEPPRPSAGASTTAQEAQQRPPISENVERSETAVTPGLLRGGESWREFRSSSRPERGLPGDRTSPMKKIS